MNNNEIRDWNSEHIITPKQTRETELREWWANQSQEEIDRTIPKAIEYGSTDLYEIGRTLLVTMGLDPDDFDEGWPEELGIYFYIIGKMARWTDAITRRERVSDDTIFDIGIYIKMLQRIRDTGHWPFNTEPERENQ